MHFGVYPSVLLLVLLAVVAGAEIEWKRHGNYLYALVKERHYAEEAEARCVEMQAHLVSIHDADENQFVHKLREDFSVWIGRNKIADPSENGTYTWTDATPSNYVAWDLRQPNEPWTNCVFMAWRPDAFGGWSDYFCNEPLPPHYKPSPPYSVCKKAINDREL